MSDNDIQHKILFFFMPRSIVFTKKESADTSIVSMLKAVSPCFYWCSGHEFITEYVESRYLIQHQIYFINGNDIEPAHVSQQWAKSKNEIRNGILSFLEMWNNDHEKVLLMPDNKFAKTENVVGVDSLNKIYKFSEFAPFVAKSILDLKDSYVQQAKMMNFDSLQKEFWRQVALNPSASKDIQHFFNVKTDSIARKTKTVKQGNKNGTKSKKRSVKKKNTKTS